jgi:flagellar biosynthetic protein FliP
VTSSAMARATTCLILLLVTTFAKATPMSNGAGLGAVPGMQTQEAPIPFIDRSNEPSGRTSLDMPTQLPEGSSSQPQAIAPTPYGTSPSNPNELRITGLGGGSAQWTIVILLTFLSLIPSILICMTPFARLLIVFHFLRQALGLQTTPSNQTLIGLSVIMTFFLMQPIGVEIYNNSVVPLQEGKITALDAVAKAGIPMRQFMSHYVRETDVALFLEMAKEPRPSNIGDVSFRVLLPAYILSELKAGFQIGAVLFLPFLVVDMVVASITTSVGMMQLPPVVISTPLKLLLFLMVDGWHLLIGALMRSFN